MPPTPDSPSRSGQRRVAVVGAGPAGLMAAEVLAGAGASVDVYEAMPSVGRKFLLAGKGGLNLTHSEPAAAFLERYPVGRDRVANWLEVFGPAAIRSWADGLGVETFVGSSGRVFPRDMKAAPLLRRWLQRLRASGVRIHTRHRWVGWAAEADLGLRFETRSGGLETPADAVVLALGGASWPQLGSDGAWVPLLVDRGIDIAPLRASNCGFDVARPALPMHSRDVAGAPDLPACAPDAVADTPGPVALSLALASGDLLPGWSEHLRSRWAGAPLKNVALSVGEPSQPRFRRRGEFVLTDGGVEGSLVYAAAHEIGRLLAAHGRAVVHLDLLPERSLEAVRAELQHPRGPRSLSTHLKSRLALDGAKAALLHELLPRAVFADPGALAGSIKSLPLTLLAARPVAEAISSAGGVRLEALGAGLMLERLPGVFCAGEMLDWDAPTGGYLLSACLASGVVAARGVIEFTRGPLPGRDAPASAH